MENKDSYVSTETVSDITPEDIKEIAKALTALGYKKVGVEDIVISKKEYEDYPDLLKNFDDYLFEYRKFADGYIKDREQKMAEKYDKKVREWLLQEYNDGYIDDHILNRYFKDLDKIAKQFGVEIKE